jgi:Protein of unknown function (DUF4012)
MWAIVAASAIGGAIADCRPAGWRPADVFFAAGFAALVSLSAAYARRWAWLATSAVALAAAGSQRLAVTCAVGAVVIAFIAIALNARSLSMGAAAGGLAVQALLRLPDFSVHGVPSLVAALAVLPVLVSGYRYAPSRGRRRVRKYARYSAAVTVLLLALGTIAALLARGHVESGITAARSGFDGFQNGDRDAATSQLNSSASSFEHASNILGSWWAAPVRVLPLVGHQLAAVKTMAEQGHTLAEDAAQTAGVIDYEHLRIRGGTINLDELRAAQGPITDTAAALQRTSDRLSHISIGWLLPPVRSRFEELARQVNRALPAAGVARDVIAVAPQMLGADSPQHYLVLFGTPAETRELGGFVGNYAEVTADKGKISLTRSGRSLDLSDPSGEANRTLTNGDYLEPFSQFRVTRFFGNVSATANFPDAASVAEQLYPQAGGTQLDGVFYMDPYALARLLDLTGPIFLKDSNEKLTSKNAAHILLVDQYVQPPGSTTPITGNAKKGKKGNTDTTTPDPAAAARKERVDFLDEATRVTFEQLTTGDLPKPVQIANVMNPIVEQGRLFGHSPHPNIEALFQRLALDGAVPSRNDGDYLSITQSNENPSKIDAYLQRDVTYDAVFRPDTGEVDGDLHVHLTNSAPATGLPDDVIGNASGRPPGTNHLFLTAYSPLVTREAIVNGVSTPIGSVKRFGLTAYTVVVDVPPGGSVDVEFKLTGTIARSSRYQLTVVRQPTVNSDHIDVTVKGNEGWNVASFPGFQLDNGTGRATIGQGRTEILTARLNGQ